MQPTIERPTVAFTLSVVGVALQGLAALLMTTFLTWFGAAGMIGPMGMMGTMGNMGVGMMSGYNSGMMLGTNFFAPVWVILTVAILGVSVWGLFLMNTTSLDKVRTGSVIILVASLLAFPTAWGFMVGSLLMFVGSILGLTWSPARRS